MNVVYILLSVLYQLGGGGGWDTRWNKFLARNPSQTGHLMNNSNTTGDSSVKHYRTIQPP